MTQNVQDERKTELVRSIKFTLFSISAGAIQLLSFTLLQLLTPLPYWPIYLISLALSVIYNYTINRKFTFRLDANIPLAMLKVFGYYCVFTPMSTIVGSYLVESLGWNEFLVEILSMFVNFVTEFLFTRFIVYGKAVDNSKSYLEKRGDEAVEQSGPVISHTAVVICAISILVSVVITVAVLLIGNRPDNRITGDWITYSEGELCSYSCDGSKATFIDGHGHETVYDCSFGDKTVTFSNDDDTRVYIWSREASTYVADHEYGEYQKLIAEKSEEIEHFSGYMTVDGDFLYMGAMCFCRESKLSGYTDASLAGEWIGAAGDKLSMSSDGGYHYVNYGLTYDGKYRVDDESGQLILTLEGEDIVLNPENWGINGRVMHMSAQFYYRAE